MSAAVDLYVAHLKARGQKSYETTGYRLRGILQTTGRDRMLRTLTVKVAKQLFKDRAPDISPDTQVGELGAASRFSQWCVDQDWLAEDPFLGIEPTGERARGKDTLRIDEARRFIDRALADDHPSGLPAAMTLLMGLRVSEVVKRAVRDLDDAGRVLWIVRAKTRKGDRTLEVPLVIRDRLVELCRGRASGDRIFGKVTRHWLAYHVVRIAKAAGVVRVTPQGLRGTQASISAGAVSVEHVAAALGHTGPTITRRHYLAKGAEQDGQQRRTLKVLQGGAA